MELICSVDQFRERSTTIHVWQPLKVLKRSKTKLKNPKIEEKGHKKGLEKGTNFLKICTRSNLKRRRKGKKEERRKNPTQNFTNSLHHHQQHQQAAKQNINFHFLFNSLTPNPNFKILHIGAAVWNLYNKAVQNNKVKTTCQIKKETKK